MVKRICGKGKFWAWNEIVSVWWSGEQVGNKVQFSWPVSLSCLLFTDSAPSPSTPQVFFFLRPIIARPAASTYATSESSFWLEVTGRTKIMWVTEWSSNWYTFQQKDVPVRLRPLRALCHPGSCGPWLASRNTSGKVKCWTTAHSGTSKE